MSKCSLCNEKSFIFIKFANNKKEKKYLRLCQNCFEKYNNILTSKRLENSKNERCPVCGYTISEFNEYRFLGCDFCYEYFYQEVLDYLKKIHMNIIYKGKFPKRYNFHKKKIEKILGLKNFWIDELKIKEK